VFAGRDADLRKAPSESERRKNLTIDGSAGSKTVKKD
jgi:hypothetical protein